MLIYSVWVASVIKVCARLSLQESNLVYKMWKSADVTFLLLIFRGLLQSIKLPCNDIYYILLYTYVVKTVSYITVIPKRCIYLILVRVYVYVLYYTHICIDERRSVRLVFRLRDGCRLHHVCLDRIRRCTFVRRTPGHYRRKRISQLLREVQDQVGRLG